MDTNTNATISKLITFIASQAFTRNDIADTIELLKKIYEQQLFSGSSSEGLSQAIQIYERTHALDETQKNVLTKLVEQDVKVSSSQLYPVINALTEEFSTYPILTLSVPVELEPEDIRSIGIWIQNNVDKKAILSFVIDPHYIGGCAVSWQGVIKDYGYSSFYEKQKRLIKSELAL